MVAGPFGGGSGGGGGAFSPGPLLSGVTGNNNDTTASAPTAGDIIFANAAPLWDDLAIGSAGQVLTVVSGLPAWATASGGAWVALALNNTANVVTVPAASLLPGVIGQVTLTAASTISNPTSPANGDRISLEFTSAASYALTWDTAYYASGLIPLPAATTGGGTIDRFFFAYNSVSTRWELIACSQATITDQHVVNTSPVANTGAGPDDLMTYTIPANTLQATGDQFQFEMYFVFAGTATKRIKVLFDGVTIADTGAILFASGTLIISGTIVRTGGTAELVWAAYDGDKTLIGLAPTKTVCTSNLATALVLKATATGGAGVAANDSTEVLFTGNVFLS